MNVVFLFCFGCSSSLFKDGHPVTLTNAFASCRRIIVPRPSSKSQARGEPGACLAPEARRSVAHSQPRYSSSIDEKPALERTCSKPQRPAIIWPQTCTVVALPKRTSAPLVGRAGCPCVADPHWVHGRRAQLYRSPAVHTLPRTTDTWRRRATRRVRAQLYARDGPVRLRSVASRQRTPHARRGRPAVVNSGFVARVDVQIESFVGSVAIPVLDCFRCVRRKILTVQV